MTQEQREKVGKTLAGLVLSTAQWEGFLDRNEVEPMDGDETADIAKYFLLELDELNGNK